MAVTLATFERKKDYLICVDSDGCAMDTMDIKHFNCFGPCMVAEWGLEEWKEPILKRWNDINLYTMTRGVNRYKGLAMALTEIDAQYKKIEDLEKKILASARDFVKLNEYTAEKEKAEEMLAEKMDRWVYLNELAEQIAKQ